MKAWTVPASRLSSHRRRAVPTPNHAAMARWVSREIDVDRDFAVRSVFEDDAVGLPGGREAVAHYRPILS